MTTITVQTVVAAAQQLSAAEQFEVIQALTRVLQQRYVHTDIRTSFGEARIVSLPSSIRRTSPMTNLADFAADFWPEDETADDINDYLTHQHTAERTHDYPDIDQ